MKAQVAILLLLAAGTVMAQDEEGNRPEPPKNGGFIKHLDKDGDGKVSQSEFDGPAEHFSHMDKNKDGFISEDEAPKGPPSGREQNQQDPQNGRERGGNFITRLDKDGDGKVSKDEFDGPADHFSHMDRNNDGFISEDEAPKGAPSDKDRK